MSSDKQTRKEQIKNRSAFRRGSLLVADSVAYDVFMMLVIVIDGIFFGLGWSDTISDNIGDTGFSIESYVIASLFAVEVLIKFIAYTPKMYFRSVWNWIDFLVTLLSWIIIIIQSEIETKKAGVVVFFRFIRLLRFLRVVSKVRAIATKQQTLDMRLPAARCIETLQVLRKQLGHNIPAKKVDEHDERITHEDLMFVINQIRDRTLYQIVLGADDMGDDEMRAYLEATASVVVEDAKDVIKHPDRTLTEIRRRSSAQSTSSDQMKTSTPQPTEVVALEMSLFEITGMNDLDAAQVDTILARAPHWDFDIFELSAATKGRELPVLAFRCMNYFNLFSKFKIPQDVFLKFVTTIEKGYRTNPYHNKIHAADVLQASFSFLTEGGLGRILSDYEVFAIIVSAVVHDYEHPGTNNAYLSGILDELAVRYNDKAVLEMHHVAAAFKLMTTDPTLNILAPFNKDEFKQIRQMMIDIVLGTEMAVHFEVVALFKSKVADGGLNFDLPADRTLCLKMLVHVADVSNPGRAPPQAAEWTRRVMDEFFEQGDEERKRGMKISPFMDRYTTSTAKCQVGFIDFIVKPLYTTWADFLKLDPVKSTSSEIIANSLMENVTANRDFWNTKKEEEDAAAKLAESLANPSAAPSPLPASPQLITSGGSGKTSRKQSIMNGK